MAIKVNSLDELLELAISNPSVATSLKSDPQGVANLFGITLSKTEEDSIRQSLDVNQLQQFATQVNAMPAKVMAGIGLKPKAP